MRASAALEGEEVLDGKGHMPANCILQTRGETGSL
jgi:hypothetical protein